MFNTYTYELHRAEVRRRALATRVVSPGMVAASGPRYINNKLGIDVSHWQPNVDWQFLASKIGFAAAKAVEIQEGVDSSYWGDSMFATHVQGAFDARIPMIAYIFQNGYSVIAKYGFGVSFDTLKNLKRSENVEYQTLRYTLMNKEYRAIAIDVERWWQSYDEYLAYLNHQIGIDRVKVMESNWIATDLERLITHLLEGMATSEIRNVPILIYTGWWFVNTYMKMSDGSNLFSIIAQNANFKPKMKMWDAKYVVPGEVTTWEDLRAMHLPDGDTLKPDYNYFDSVFLWQIGGGGMSLPNGRFGNYGFDINLALVPNDQFDQVIKPYVIGGGSSASASVSASPSEPPPVPTGDLAAVLAALRELQLTTGAMKSEIDRLSDKASHYPG